MSIVARPNTSNQEILRNMSSVWTSHTSTFYARISRKVFAIIALLQFSTMAIAQQDIPLYEKEIPNSKPIANREVHEWGKDSVLRISKITEPSVRVFLAPKQKANGTAVIIFPGGGYRIVAASHEGYDVAKVFNEWGVTAFVVRYRLPEDSSMINKEIGPLQDAQRAIQLVREHAKHYNIDPKKVGIMGFSAGGHLASTLGTHFEKAVIENKQKTNLRPDFMILGYPVISFSDSLAHKGSRENLIGKTPSPEKIAEYSNELQVTAKTPPTFLVHARDDGGVKVQNSIAFYEALQKNNVPAEIHFYEKGGHGFGMINKTSPDRWMDWVKVWMTKNNWLK